MDLRTKYNPCITLDRVRIRSTVSSLVDDSNAACRPVSAIVLSIFSYKSFCHRCVRGSTYGDMVFYETRECGSRVEDECVREDKKTSQFEDITEH